MLAWCKLQFRGLRRDRRAVTSLEYGMIAMMVAVASVGAFNTTGSHLQTTFSHVSSEL
jgi:Flp pilus assembly pilin Flp